MKQGQDGLEVVVPTRVGVNRGRRHRNGMARGRPHTRGGEPYARKRSEKRFTSSPHAWG